VGRVVRGGSGVVFGSGNGDILIGGTTAYDLDQNGEPRAHHGRMDADRPELQRPGQSHP
jgi:hypothetical protein